MIGTTASVYINEDGQVVLEMTRVERPSDEPTRKVLTRRESRAYALLILKRQGDEGMADAKAFVNGTFTINIINQSLPTSPLEGGTYRTPPMSSSDALPKKS
jgi:hypothetical protein